MSIKFGICLRLMYTFVSPQQQTVAETVNGAFVSVIRRTDNFTEEKRVLSTVSRSHLLKKLSCPFCQTSRSKSVILRVYVMCTGHRYRYDYFVYIYGSGRWTDSCKILIRKMGTNRKKWTAVDFVASCFHLSVIFGDQVIIDIRHVVFNVVQNWCVSVLDAARRQEAVS